MRLIRAIAFAAAAAAARGAPDARDVSNTSWWRLALAAPVISPDFTLVSKHVCERGSTFAHSEIKNYFPSDCSERINSLAQFHQIYTKKLNCEPSGLGHVGVCVVEMIADRRSPGPGARYFQQYVGYSGVYLRGVDGLGDGFAPSLYCHERDWLNAHLFATSNCKRSHSKQDCTANATCAWHEKKERCMENSKPKKLGREVLRVYPTGDALFRDHFECFVAPPFDEWFGFDALPPADDPARGRRAVAEAYAAVDRDAWVDCGAADGELRVVVHARLGDLIHTPGGVALRASTAAGARLRNALRVVAELRARLPERRVHALILSDSPPETVAATLEGLDVGIRVGGARRDGASHLVDGRTVGLENDFDVSFHGAGHPFVALHCMAAADLLLWPETCGNPWPAVPKTGHPKPGHRRMKTNSITKRCSHMVSFARELSLRGVPRGLPVKPLDATAVDAGVEELLKSGFPVEPLDATAVDGNSGRSAPARALPRVGRAARAAPAADDERRPARPAVVLRAAPGARKVDSLKVKF